MYLKKTNNMFSNVTSLSNEIKNTVSVLTLVDSNINEVVDLNNQTIGMIKEIDTVATVKSIKDLENKKVIYEAVEYPGAVELASALYNGEVDAIIFNEAYRSVFQDIEDFWSFNKDTKAINQTIFYTKREKALDKTSNPVNNIMSDTFTVFISGNDSYGSLNEASRSDVNMLVTVNPKTHVVLMTSIPRDYYVEEVCTPADACNYGMMDKLTHTGLHGIQTTEESIENLLNITINYNVRVNFSSLVNLVDAIGGIDVLVEQGKEVVRFSANDTKGVTGGWNHLEGERALAFARERHAYEDGDFQRVQNQQIVMKAIIDKLTSPTMFSHYGDFIDALSGAFETNMSLEEMNALLRYEITFRPHWEFASFAMSGTPDFQMSAALGDFAYVTVLDDNSVDLANKKIKAVIDGDSIENISSIE